MAIFNTQVIPADQIPTLRIPKPLSPEYMSLLEQVKALTSGNVLQVTHNNCEKSPALGKGFICELQRNLNATTARKFQKTRKQHSQAGTMFLWPA